MPATINWTNPLGGSWATPANWNLNRVPAAGDDVVIPDLGSAGADLTISASTDVAIQSLTSAENLRIDGGVFSVQQTPAISGNVTVNAGVYRPGGVTNAANITVTNGAALAVTPA